MPLSKQQLAGILAEKNKQSGIAQGPQPPKSPMGLNPNPLNPSSLSPSMPNPFKSSPNQSQAITDNANSPGLNRVHLQDPRVKELKAMQSQKPAELPQSKFQQLTKYLKSP